MLLGFFNLGFEKFLVPVERSFCRQWSTSDFNGFSF